MATATTIVLGCTLTKNDKSSVWGMLTTEGHPELLEKAKALGARAWMVKPVREEIIVATVRKLTVAA